MEDAEISEMERGFPIRQLNDQDVREIERLAKTVTEHIMLNEDEEGVEIWKKHSIYKVPAHVVAVNPEAFKPQVVSIGPYHHGKDHLKPMEVHKHRAARCFIQNSEKTTEDYIKALWEVLPKLMDSYSQLDQFWVGENRGRFVELMLVDGCFLLEILRICNSDFRSYDDHDPVFSGYGLAFDFNLWLDLYMLENQVPFTAIERLLTVQNDKTPEGLTRGPKNLQNTLNGMQSVIEDAKEKKVQSPILRGWLITMKEVAYEANDVLNEFSMKILQTIGKIGSNNKGNCKYIVNLMSLILVRRPDPGVGQGLHMLDVARKILVEPKDIVPNIKELEEDERLKLMLDFMRRPGGWVHAEKDKLAALVKKMNMAAKSRSVMELCDAGVEFRAADEEVVALSSIKFGNGVLTLPIIRPSYKFEVLGCNMVAFEDIHGGNLHNAAFCFSFMKGLLSSVEDVRHLRSLKIIQSIDLSDEGILQTFRRILSGKLLMSNLFSKLNRLQDQLDEFYLNRTTGCGGRLWKWITSLKRKYFHNPWTFVAVVSAALLLALAMTQTYYTALPYWDSNHKND